MIVLLLACVGVSRADDYYITIWLTGQDKINVSQLTTTFGDDFTVKYAIDVYNQTKNRTEDNGNLKIYLKDESGVERGPLFIDDFKYLPVGTYKMKIQFKNSTIHDYSVGKTLTVKKRPITFFSQHYAVFHCMYNGGRTFKLADYDDGTGSDAGKLQWYTAYGIGNLASFDESTQIDFDKTLFEFSNSEASETMKGGTIHWALKADPNKTEDWSANYECQNLNTKEACECENAFDGYIHNKCPYRISWISNGATVSENFSSKYGMKVGADDYATQSYYDLVPLMYDNGTLIDESLNIEISQDGFIFKTYLEGSVISVGDYVFRASSGNTPACKSQIAVEVSPLPVEPVLGAMEKEKFYDNNTNLTSYSDKATPSKPFLGDDGNYLQIRVDAQYDSPESGDRQINISFELEGQDDIKKNYVLTTDGWVVTGKINPIQPTIQWAYDNHVCENQHQQTIDFGESINAVVAELQLGEHDAFRSKYPPTAVYEVYHNGIKLADDAKLEAGETYKLKAIFVSDIPNNLLSVESSIDVTFSKKTIMLGWLGTNKDKLEYPNAKIADPNAGFGYIAVNAIAKSDIQYEYYLSSDLTISEDELLTDANKKEVGFAPTVGKYMFGCIAKDAKGYMLDGKISEQIEIKKSSVRQKIDLPEIKPKKNYDGNWFAEVVTPASFHGVPLKTVAYFVDGSITDNVITQLSETDLRKDYGWNYSVYYSIEVPQDIIDNTNLYVRSFYEDEQIKYIDYHSGDFYYYDGGIIDCNEVVLTPLLPANAIYGDCVLAGDDDDDVRIYTTVDGNAISIEGEWSFWGNLDAGDILDAKTHSIDVFFNSNDDNYCDDAYTEVNVIVQPRTLTFVGDLNIADKTYDGTDIINSNGVVTTFENGVVDASKLSEYFPANQQIRRVPSVEGVISQDYGKVSVKWDYSNTKYSGSAVKYTDDTELEVAAYENIPIGVSLEGSRAFNYKLPQDVVYGSSKIMPENPVEIVFDYISPEPPIADLTYRLMYGKSVMGVDFKLKAECLKEGWYERYVLNSEDCTFKMMSPKENTDDYYTFEVQIIKGDREQDAANNSYKVLGRQSVRIYVDKYKLQVSAPNIVKQKEYDGNTSVAWTDGNNCVITNAVAGDDVALDGEPVIQYDTPEVGTGKTITATYTLKGNDLYKYILPDNYTTTGSIIKEEVTPPNPPDPPNPPNPPDPPNPPVTGNIVIADVTPVSGGTTVSPNEDGYCAGEQIIMNIKISEGSPAYCKIVFDDNSKNAGFKDVENADVNELGNGMFQYSFECPGATYGKYGGQLYLYDADGKASNGYAFEVQVNYSSKYLKAKFNDVVLVDNHEKPRLFSENNPDITYQWYIREDGIDKNVPGETKQFYNVPTMDAWYGAYAKTSSDDWIKICPKYFGKTLSKSYVVEPSVSVYPNPAVSLEPVTIKINDFDSDSYNSVIIYLYNSTGSLVKTIENVEELNVVSLPFGNYSGIVVFDGNKISFKFIVRK